MRELATRFAPSLRFDSSEVSRPLNVAGFLMEPRNRLCPRKGGRCVLLATSNLRRMWSANSYIDIDGSFDSRPLRSPYPGCRAAGLMDCDTGGATATYYGMTPRAGSLMPFFDYWFFYRENYWTGEIDFHEGDWERVTVAPDPSGKVVDFVALSQHEKVWAYVRDAVRCQASRGALSLQGGCSDPARTHVTSFVANGSHANYATPCASRCPQNIDTPIGHLREKPHDGSREWGAPIGGDNLIPLPPSGTFAWSEWPGLWGPKGLVFKGPASPGTQKWTFGTCKRGPACPLLPAHDKTRGIIDESAIVSVLATRAGHRHTAASRAACTPWQGPDVALALCDPARLAGALHSGTVSAAPAGARA